MASASHVKDGVIQDSWEEIAEACNKGLAEKYYSIGDVKELDLGEIGTVHMEMVGFYSTMKGTGNAATTTWISKEVLCGSDQTSIASWITPLYPDPQSIATYFNNSLPEGLLENIKEREMWSLHYDSNAGNYSIPYSVVRSIAKLWCPSADECRNHYYVGRSEAEMVKHTSKSSEAHVYALWNPNVWNSSSSARTTGVTVDGKYSNSIGYNLGTLLAFCL